MRFNLWKFSRLALVSGAVAIALTTSVPPLPATAQLFNSPVDQLPAQDRAALRSGRVLMSGRSGQYTARVLVNGSVTNAWNVLTDYNHFANYFPTVQSSRLLQSSGNRRVFEQVNVVRIFPITRRSRVVIAATETYHQQIAFQLVEGDVKTLQGVWKVEPVAPYSGATPNQVLITHQVTVDPGSTSTRGIFFNVYQSTLESTLSALKQEIERRG